MESMEAMERAHSSKTTGPVGANEPRPGAAWTPPSLPGLEFPGCAPRRLRRSELATYERRLEFWDAETETAWVCEQTPPCHERPSQALAALAERIAMARGSPVTCYGSMDLWLRDAHGEPRRIMQADQSVYVRPLSAKLPGDLAMMVGEHDFPDVVLEVDHTTDVRRGKLGLYERWGFPEVWVQVPDRPSASRPRSQVPGLTIHLLEGGTYRTSGESRTFPGWTVEVIHAALDAAVPSAETLEVLERVGLALGAREGTGPDDDPLLRSLVRRWIQQGLERGLEQGIEEGTQRGLEQGIQRGLEHVLAAERELLRRLAARRFGAATAAELARRIATMSDPADLAEVGDLVIDCDTGDSLLDRLGTA